LWNNRASAGAGVVCSFSSLPFDNIKTKLQKMKAGPDGSLPYTGVADCFKKSIAREGFLRLWAGIPVYYSRVAPYSMIVLFINIIRLCLCRTNFIWWATWDIDDGLKNWSCPLLIKNPNNTKILLNF